MKKSKRAAIMSFALVATMFLMTRCQFEAFEAMDRDVVSRALVRQDVGISINDNFADDRLVVILTAEASLRYIDKDFTPEFFPEIEHLIRIEDSTEHTAEVARMQIHAQSTGDFSLLADRVQSGMLVNIPDFRRILELRLSVNCKSYVLEAVEILSRRPEVHRAEPDFIFEIDRTYQMYSLDFLSYSDDKYCITNLHLQQTALGDSHRILVGILDDGIFGNHPALVNRVCWELSRNFFYCTCGIVRNCGADGLVGGGHGTPVAGVVANVNPNARLVSLVVYRRATLSVSRLLAAIDYATGVGIPILNLSIVARTRHDYNIPGIYYAIRNYPGLFVGIAGNHSRNIDNAIHNQGFIYPARFDLSNLITVGALNAGKNGRRGDSNYSRTHVEVFAPGTNIRTTYHRGGFMISGHTSMAAPFVAGIASLILYNQSLRGDPPSNGHELRQNIVFGLAEVIPALRNYSLSSARLTDAHVAQLRRFAGGTGTQAHPFLIGNREHLANISMFTSAYFRLVNDIAVAQWSPIWLFFGNLDGNNHKIKGLSVHEEINRNSIDNYGLVRINEGTIRNLRVSANIILNFMYTHMNPFPANAGVIAGSNFGTIENVRVSAFHDYHIVLAARQLVNSSIGGIAGRNFGHIISSRNYGTLYGHGNVGEIAGLNFGVITNSRNWDAYMLSDY